MPGRPGDELTWKERVDRFLRRPTTDAAVIVLILLSVILLLLESHATDPRERELLDFWGNVISAIFVVELSLRYWVAESKKQFWLSYWVDVISVLPILRPLRVLRVLRLLRIVRIGLMLNRRISAMSRTFRERSAEMVVVAVLLCAVLLVSAVGLHYAEPAESPLKRLGYSMWWSLSALVSGGPIEGAPVPKSLAGKVFLLLVMLSSMTIFAIMTGVVSAGMIDSLRNTVKDQKIEIQRLRDHVIICGINRMIGRIIEELQYLPDYRHTGIVVVAEFEDPPALPERIRYPGNVYFLPGDYTRLSVLREAGIQHASTAILLADKTKPRSDQDRDARTVLAAMLIEREARKLGRDIFTCVELLNPDNMEQLRVLGVEELVVLDEYGGSIIAASSANQGMVPVFNELFTRGWGNAFFKKPLPEELHDADVREAMLWLKEKWDAILLAVDRPGRQKPIVNPPTDLKLQQGDMLVLIAPTDHTADGSHGT